MLLRSSAVQFWPWASMRNSSVYGNTTSYTAPLVSSHGHLGITRYAYSYVCSWIDTNSKHEYEWISYFCRLCFLALATTN